MMKRKSVAFVLILAMIISVLPASMWVDKAEAETTDRGALVFDASDGKIYIDVNENGIKGTDDITEYTDQNNKWSWDSENKILTLKGFNYETTGKNAMSIFGDVTIKLEDKTTNTLSGGTNGINIPSRNPQLNLTITGTGILNVNGGNSTSDAGYGIRMYGALTVEGGVINAFGSAEKDNANSAGINIQGDMTINGGEVNASSYNTDISKSYGINLSGITNKLYLNGGVIAAYGLNYFIYSSARFIVSTNIDMYQYWSGTSSGSITDPIYYTKTPGDNYDTPYTGNKYLKIDTTAEFPKTYLVDVNPTTVAFGDLQVGYEEQEYETIVITNTGTGIITSLSAVISSGSNRFELTPAAVTDQTIAAGESITVSVRPMTGLSSREINYTGVITITANNNITKTVPLSVKVNAKNFGCTPSPSSISFSALTAGYYEADLQSQTIEIKNTGEEPLNNLSIQNMNSFEVVSYTSPFSIATGSSAYVTVRPTMNLSPGNETENLTITNNEGFSQVIPLSVEVKEPSINDIVNQIGKYNDYHNGFGELTATAIGNNTITVDGEVTNAVNPQSLRLYVPEGCKIIWNAEYSAKLTDAAIKRGYALIHFEPYSGTDNYASTFELTKNGLLSLETPYWATLLDVLDSTVNIMGQVRINGTSQTSSSAIFTNAIYPTDSIVKVTDGNVTAEGYSNAFSLHYSCLLYLKNTIFGNINPLYDDSVIEIDSLINSSTRHGRSDGLKLLDELFEGQINLYNYTAKWDMSGDIPVIEVFQYEHGGRLLSHERIQWGTKITESISGTTVDKITDKTWSGSDIKPAPVVKYGGQTLKNGTDYTLTYKNNKSIGKATVVITGKRLYQGTKTVTFNIIPKKVSIKKLTVGKKKITVTWKKSSSSQKITKYQIQYRIKGKKSWSKAKNFSPGTTKATIKKLKKGKRYQFRVRVYKTVNGEKYYSPWSSVKTSKKIK